MVDPEEVLAQGAYMLLYTRYYPFCGTYFILNFHLYLKNLNILYGCIPIQVINKDMKIRPKIIPLSSLFLWPIYIKSDREVKTILRLQMAF